MSSARFSTKILLVTVIPVMITALVLAYVLISGRVDEFNKRTNDKGNDVSNYVATISEFGLFTGNFDYLESTLVHTINQQDIVAVYIEDNNKNVVVKKINKRYQNIDIYTLDENIYMRFSANIVKTSIDIDDLRSVPGVNTGGNNILGRVNIIMDLRRASILKTDIIRNSIFTTIILTLGTIFIALLFARSVTDPIRKISKSVNVIKQGDLNHRVSVDFSGELAELADGINKMTSSLEDARLEEMKKNEALSKAKKEAECANRAKTLFLSSMSHEMRTPMNAIQGFSQLIEMDTEEEETRNNAREILTSSQHLLELIESLLDISQIESGNINLYIDSYELKSMLDVCISMVKPIADKMNVNIENRSTAKESYKIDVDNKKFKQVIINLLSNAIKYNIKSGNIIIDSEIDDRKELCLSITDTGKGIEEKYQDNLFNYFDRAGQECSNITGNGLGLAITKKLIEKMNGTIGFESVANEGSRFWIKVPLSKK